MDDIALRQHIIDALDFEPAIDAANIGVSVDQGIATITGHVSTFGQKTRVEEAVQRVKGVRGLVEKLEVHIFGDIQDSDENIARRALNVIGWNSFVPKDTIHVKVQKGWVTLSGNVEWDYQRREAFNSVKGLSGVVGVTNSIELNPTPAVSDVKQRIEDALKRAAKIEAQGIKVNILDHGTIKLEGKVHNWSERAAAERAAWSAPGVKRVVDQLQVA